ncbi:hypothetical protein [Labilithrix luteola]|uniref:hypothetical protein n=1 Tax=Labilithrix luteola TaxID=1391654 RepID=UPI0014751E72|nr:hypothetical protein [Labilithrix luteola]
MSATSQMSSALALHEPSNIGSPGIPRSSSPPSSVTFLTSVLATMTAPTSSSNTWNGHPPMRTPSADAPHIVKTGASAPSSMGVGTCVHAVDAPVKPPAWKIVSVALAIQTSLAPLPQTALNVFVRFVGVVTQDAPSQWSTAPLEPTAQTSFFPDPHTAVSAVKAETSAGTGHHGATSHPTPGAHDSSAASHPASAPPSASLASTVGAGPSVTSDEASLSEFVASDSAQLGSEASPVETTTRAETENHTLVRGKIT